MSFATRPILLTLSAVAPFALLAPGASAVDVMVRPDSASATSVFSASYAAANTINGSGLPANFTPSSPHANYTTGNHWTTAAGHTVGESITFSFNSPQSLGGFYMWAHRSNNIASNPYYTAVRFDLVFRDGAGNVINTIPDLVGVPGITTAQTYAFPIVSGVRSVQFIVRATDNNNSSPYTGLAEVAFADCIGVTTSMPGPQLTCPGGAKTLTVSAVGSGPLTYQWRRIPLAGVPTPITNGGRFSGADTATLTITGVQPEDGVSYDVVVTGACGPATSDPVALTVSCPNRADVAGLGGSPGCDGQNTVDDIVYYLSQFFGNNVAVADLVGLGGSGGPDGQVSVDDLVAFLSAFFAGCP